MPYWFIRRISWTTPRFCCSRRRNSARSGSAEVGVDQLAAVPQGAEGVGGHALELGALLEQQEAFEQRARVADEHAPVTHVEEPRTHWKRSLMLIATG